MLLEQRTLTENYPNVTPAGMDPTGELFMEDVPSQLKLTVETHQMEENMFYRICIHNNEHYNTKYHNSYVHVTPVTTCLCDYLLLPCEELKHVILEENGTVYDYKDSIFESLNNFNANVFVEQKYSAYFFLNQ
tara:strand:+ start:732 stop:1130 length:399 start_codon:yes stop_codon:yes gene_type:complete